MLRARWLGRVRYRDAHALQHALWQARTGDDWLLLLEHPHVYTLGVRADLGNVLVPPADVGAELVRTDRGGDVTYHGPGQLVGYPILTVPPGPGSTPKHVHAIEQVVIDVLADLGLPGAQRLDEYPGVWVDGRKICAVGVRISRGRSMHGFALNVHPDMAMFGHIVPCGIADKPVTSLYAEGVDVSMHEVVDAVVHRWSADERQDVAWRVQPEDVSSFTRSDGTAVRLLGRLAEAGVQGGLAIEERKPEWLRVKADMGPEFRGLKQRMRSLNLVTVCEEAGCPNIFECWADGTATFMINGERCTRACGFCLVDTRKPEPLHADEPERVARAVADMRLSHAVVTAVARDDLPDGGAAAFAATVEAIHRRCPGTTVEVLIPDCKGDPDALHTLFAARPEILNHNIETVARLQRAVRPSASTSSPSASTCGPPRTTCRWPAGGRPPSSTTCGTRAYGWGSPTSRRRRSPDRATTPSRRRAHSSNRSKGASSTLEQNVASPLKLARQPSARTSPVSAFVSTFLRSSRARPSPSEPASAR